VPFGVIGVFVLALVDPPAFSLAMLPLQNVPEVLRYIFLAIIGFWFGTKMIEKAPRRMRGPSLEDVKRVHDLEAERRYRQEIADTSKPLTNAAILEWNRRRKRTIEVRHALVWFAFAQWIGVTTSCEGGTRGRSGQSNFFFFESRCLFENHLLPISSYFTSMPVT